MADPLTIAATAIAKPLASKLIDTLLKPVLTAGQLVTDPLVDTFTNRFSEYLTRQYTKHSHLPTIVFQSKKPIEELYIPITVTEQGTHYAPTDPKKQFKVDRYDPRFLPKYERVLLIDDAGMGKTTASRFLLVEATKNQATIPVFVELRHLSPDKTLLDFMLSELNQTGTEPSDLKIDKRQLVRLLEKGVFTFFLDGYDEISLKNRERVTIDIKSIVNTFPSNKYMLTSRPEHALASFPSFKAFKIEPLKRSEAYSLIRKYDNNGENAERLIAKLEDKSLRAVHEFLHNPLLTTLLYRAYDYKNQIPLKKPVFYRQVFDALYEWHDLTKDGYSTRTKQCGLDVDGFHRVLRGLGFISVLKNAIEADTDEILKWIREARTYAPELRFSESDFLEDAIKAVPVLRREGNSIMWAHKSLAEYFAAQFIATDAKIDQERICKHIAESKSLRSYSNMLDLLYDIDVALFGQFFIIPLLEFLNKEIVKLKSDFPNIDNNLIERRAAASLGQRVVPLHTKLSLEHAFSGGHMQMMAQSVADEWFGIGKPSSKVQSREFAEGITIEFRSFDHGRLDRSISINSGSGRALIYNHPLKTILEILTEKKHPLILQHQFYPPSTAKARIVGLRATKTLKLIDNKPDSIWNSLKNFDQTSQALQKISFGIINLEKVNSVTRGITLSTQQSSTTTNLLASLCK